MSYRSFKRVLGETSLERKCRWLFGICLLCLITGSFWWYGTRTESLVYAKTTSTGQRLVDAIMLQNHFRKWKNNAIEQSTAEELTKGLQTLPYEYRFIKPLSPNAHEQPQDEFELELLEKFQKQKPQPTTETGGRRVIDYAERRIPEKSEYQFYQPVYWNRQDCRGCHQVYNQSANSLIADIPRPQFKEGDLMAVVKVEIPDGETQKALNHNRAILLATAFVTVFLAMMAAYIIVRYVIVKPLKHLRDVTDAISHGNMEMRAEINMADEFEELGKAFNRMLRHLTAIQEELRQVNSNLDGKVDELAQANMRLYELNRLKSDFLATMSHELRTPLNSIIGFSDVLDGIKSLDDKQRRYVQNIQKSGRVLLDMINDILDLAKIESGNMEVRLSEFRIEQVIVAQCDTVRLLAERKNIDLDCDIQPDLPPLYQDAGKVQQILNNLLSNAIKFTPEGGRIVVAAKADTSGELLMDVIDTGVGISEEDQATIFEKFRQGQAVLSRGDAITREYSGTGLGLSIVKELCKLLGGEITLQSELGKGSAFTVRLPWTGRHVAKAERTRPEELEELLRPRRGDLLPDREPLTPASSG